MAAAFGPPASNSDGGTMRNAVESFVIWASVFGELIERSGQLVRDLSQGPTLHRIQPSVSDVPDDVGADENWIDDAVHLALVDAVRNRLREMSV